MLIKSIKRFIIYEATFFSEQDMKVHKVFTYSSFSTFLYISILLQGFILNVLNYKC